MRQSALETYTVETVRSGGGYDRAMGAGTGTAAKGAQRYRI